jgi:thiol-disulfide isomerase/thioredoxin
MRKLFAAVVAAGFAAVAVAQDPKPKTVPAAPIQKGDEKAAPKKEKAEPTLKVGDAAPALKADKWMQGAEVKALEPGKTYVVEFWATWCGPCIVMMPHMAEMQHDYRDKGVTFIGFSSKDPNNSQEKVAAFVEKRGPKLGYTFAYQDSRETNDAWMKAAARNGIPCCFVVNKEGKIAYIGHPMYLDLVLPKVVEGTFGDADRERVEEADAGVKGVFDSVRAGKDEEIVRAVAEFEGKYPALAGIPYFNAPKLNALLKLKKFDQAKAMATALITKAVKQSDPMPLQSVAAILRGPLAKEQKELVATAVSAAEALVTISGEKDLTAMMTASATYDAAGDKAKAVEFAKKAIPLAEKEVKGDKDWQGMMRVADAHFAAGDKAKAKEMADKALAAAPEGNKALRDFIERQAKKFGDDKDDK